MTHSYLARWAACLFVASALWGCQSSQQDKPTAGDDAKSTEGVWTLVSGEAAGQPLAEDVVKNSKLTIVGDAYTVQLGEMSPKQGTQKLDSTKSPKQIDAQDSAGPTVGLNLGIYEFLANGDFRVCFAATGQDRPTTFATTPDDGRFIHVWRRAK